MPIDSEKQRIVSAIGSYVLVVIAVSLFWALVTKLVLLNLQSFPEQYRQGWDNPFLSFFAVTAVFLLLAHNLYGVMVFFFLKSPAPMKEKIILGFIAGLLPDVCLHLMTFGIPLGNPSMVTELLVMGIGGALFPIIQKRIASLLDTKTE